MTDKNVSKNRGIPHNEMRDEGEKKSRDEGLQSGQTNPPFSLQPLHNADKFVRLQRFQTRQL